MMFCVNYVLCRLVDSYYDYSIYQLSEMSLSSFFLNNKKKKKRMNERAKIAIQQKCVFFILPPLTKKKNRGKISFLSCSKL